MKRINKLFHFSYRPTVSAVKLCVNRAVWCQPLRITRILNESTNSFSAMSASLRIFILS